MQCFTARTVTLVSAATPADPPAADPPADPPIGDQSSGQDGGFLSPENWQPGPRRSLIAPARKPDLILAHALGYLDDDELELALAA